MPWYFVILHGITWHTMAYHDITKKAVVDHAFSYIVYGKSMVYHGLPVSKHHATHHSKFSQGTGKMLSSSNDLLSTTSC